MRQNKEKLELHGMIPGVIGKHEGTWIKFEGIGYECILIDGIYVRIKG